MRYRLLLIVLLLPLVGCQATVGVPRPVEQGGSEQMLYVKQTKPSAGECSSECWLSREALIQFAQLGLKTGEICGGIDLDVRGLEQGDASITRDVVQINGMLEAERLRLISVLGADVANGIIDGLRARLLGLPGQ